MTESYRVCGVPAVPAGRNGGGGFDSADRAGAVRYAPAADNLGGGYYV